MDNDNNKGKTGVPYITENENIFIAPEGLSSEEFDRISLETDINALREKLSKMEAELEEKKKTEHTEEIERNAPFEDKGNSSSEPFLFKYKTGNFRKILVLDTETTGLNPSRDELLQFSAVDGNGNELFNSYIRPSRHSQWSEAMKKNHITPEMVKDKPYFKEIRNNIQKLIDEADLIVSYNGGIVNNSAVLKHLKFIYATAFNSPAATFSL